MVRQDVKAAPPLSGQAPGVHQPFNRQPFGAEALGIEVGGHQREPSAIDPRQPGCGRAVHLMRMPGRVVGKAVVEPEADADRQAAAASGTEPPGQRLPADKSGCRGQQAAPPAGQRNGEPQWPDEMGRQPHQPIAFRQTFSNQVKLNIFEVAEAAVDQPG